MSARGGQPGVKVGSTVGVELTCVRKQQDEGLGVVVCMLFILITQRFRYVLLEIDQKVTSGLVPVG